MGGTGAALVLLRFHVPMEEGGTGGGGVREAIDREEKGWNTGS
jgi:hypothetical protein